VGLDYQYSFKILKISNQLGEEGVKNIKKKSQEHPRVKELLLKEKQFQKLKLNKLREIYGNFAG
jgi:hypothetical protein